MSRLAVLATEIRSLQAAAMEHERDAIDLGDEHAIERAAFTEARLKTALRCYFIESEAQRFASTDCPIHGHAILVTCPECVERSPQLRPIYEAYLADVAKSEQAETPRLPAGVGMLPQHASRSSNDDSLVHALTASVDAVAVGRRHGVEPRVTLQILKASRRTA